MFSIQSKLIKFLVCLVIVFTQILFGLSFLRTESFERNSACSIHLCKMASGVGKALLGKGCEMVLNIAVRRLAEEAKLVVQFGEDFRWLNRELTYLSGFLKDADQQSRHSEDVRKWLEEIRLISLLAEDIVEECAVDARCGNSWISQLIDRRNMGWRIKDIKDRTRSVIEKAGELKLLHQVASSANELTSPSTSSQRLDWKRSSVLPSGSDSHTVGIQSKVDDLLRLLEKSGSPVIAVVGMGGMGKTHLLQHVCNHNNIKKRYGKSIWLSVSQSYSVSQLQKDLVFQLDEDLHKEIKGRELSEQVLAQLIYEKVQGKRCLVVLDDVWRAHREDDLLARLGLPITNASPYRIVVTTRSKEVCANLNAETYEMQLLSDEESWRLFCVYALKGSQVKREPEKRLEEVGRRIVKQCGNLPLAIKTIAASLAKSRMLREWESKLQQLRGVQGIATVGTIIPILRLSYDSLPAILKACFAYLSFFPEDAKIHPEYLINLWIGEGFIPAGEGQWDAGWACLSQLADLCLLQLFEEEEDLRFILRKYCRVHDLLLDLAIQVSKENRSVFSIEEVSEGGNAGCCRILLGNKDINDKNISETRPVCLRTLSLSQNKDIRSIPANLFTAMRGLRVLDLSKTSISALPENVGNMKLLKVLNLYDTNIKEVPECVRHLKSLLFLALSYHCSKLPMWINEVKCLQHLQCPGVEGRIPKGISELVSLRKLQTRGMDLSVEEEDEFLNSEDLSNMSQLQELWLNVKHGMELEWIRTWPVKMRRLFIGNGTTELIELPEKMAEMKDLEILMLWNFAVPNWICGFVNLRELSLIECHCGEYPELQIMPNLVKLDLSGDSKCREFPKAFGNAGGFPQLRFFTIMDFTELEEFPELEEGSMKCLEKFCLYDCPKVKKLGERLERFQKLDIY